MSDLRLNKRFKVSVIVNIVRLYEGVTQILAQERKQHPAFGDVTTIAGKVLAGESIVDAGRRKLFEETGLHVDKLVVIGILRKIRVTKEQKIIDDVHYYVCYGENPKGDLIPENDFGKNFWINIDKFQNINAQNNDVGKMDAKMWERIAKNDLRNFIFEERFILEKY